MISETTEPELFMQWPPMPCLHMSLQAKELRHIFSLNSAAAKETCHGHHHLNLAGRSRYNIQTNWYLDQ